MPGTIYQRLGGAEAVAGVVDRFYDKVLADPSINHFFENIDMEAQRRHQTAFMSYALGGPMYTGRSMEKAHAGLNLRSEHFDAVVGHLASALRESGVDEGDIDTALNHVGKLRQAVLHK